MFSRPCGAARDFKFWCHTTHFLSSINSLYFVTYCLIPFENSKAADGFGGDTIVGISEDAIGLVEDVHKSNNWRSDHVADMSVVTGCVIAFAMRIFLIQCQ